MVLLLRGFKAFSLSNRVCFAVEEGKEAEQVLIANSIQGLVILHNAFTWATFLFALVLLFREGVFSVFSFRRADAIAATL